MKSISAGTKWEAGMPKNMSREFFSKGNDVNHSQTFKNGETTGGCLNITG